VDIYWPRAIHHIHHNSTVNTEAAMQSDRGQPQAAIFSNTYLSNYTNGQSNTFKADKHITDGLFSMQHNQNKIHLHH
jgi:hypothetical protein